MAFACAIVEMRCWSGDFHCSYPGRRRPGMNSLALARMDSTRGSCGVTQEAMNGANLKSSPQYMSSDERRRTGTVSVCRTLLPESDTFRAAVAATISWLE